MKYFIVFTPFLCMSMAHEATEQLTVSPEEKQLIDLWIANEHLNKYGLPPSVATAGCIPGEKGRYHFIKQKYSDSPWLKPLNPVFSQEEWDALAT